jgi:hypothetical protein
MLIGKSPKDTSAPTEEYLVIIKTNSHIIIVKSAVCGVYINSMPKLVATPLPPLNLRKREKLCPNTAHNPMSP